MTCPICKRDNDDWELKLAEQAFRAGQHIPVSWILEYDDGADGCMPTGWYVIGADASGMAMYWPIRHEYGPFESQEQAAGFAAEERERLAAEERERPFESRLHPNRGTFDTD